MPAFARKNSTLWTIFRKPAFLVPECLKRRKKNFQFSELSRYVWTDTWSNKFLLYFSSAHDWDRDNMDRETNVTNGRPATGKRHRNFICRCVSLPTPRPFWLEYSTGSPSSKYEHRRASALLRNIQNIWICMEKKPIVSVTYENERISIKNSLPYLKCLLRLSCVVHGPIYGRFMGLT